jgi:DNA-binding MarR family transcriptional regulator
LCVPASHARSLASQAVELVFAVWTRGKLTPRQLALLLVIEECEGLNQTELMERSGIDRSTLSDVVRRLRRKGLIQRRRTRDDARAYAVSLTDEGRRMLRAVLPIAAGVEQAALNALPSGQREAFLTALVSIVAALERSG